jgi:acetyl-CoA carboxylase carboxyltransferase component
VSTLTPEVTALRDRILAGGSPKYHAANAARGKLFARERLDLLLDADTFVEDGLYANALEADLPADGVVTGFGRVNGRQLGLAHRGEDHPHPGAGG